MEPAIVCQNLKKRYGNFTALDGLNLQVPAGSIFGFLGPNGAGKTTTLRLLTGLAEASAGYAMVLGVNVRLGGADLREKIGYLEQQPRFYGWMRGRELLKFAGELFGLRGTQLNARVDEVLELTDLQEAANRKIGGYSGGMLQRLGLAQAMINRPEVLFLDEPVSSLDPAGRHDILRTIEQLRGQATVFMSTHILADVERVADHVAIINQGRLVVESTVSDLQQRYAQPVFVLQPASGQEPQVAALTARLEVEAWVSSVTRTGDELRVVVRDPDRGARALLPLVVEAGLILDRFERARASLEDIFLRLVGTSDAGAADVPEQIGTVS